MAKTIHPRPRRGAGEVGGAMITGGGAGGGAIGGTGGGGGAGAFKGGGALSSIAARN